MEKYRIIANKEQLLSIGIDYEISGLEGIFKKEFKNTGYIELEVKHNLGKFELTNNFDFPKSYIEKITV